MSHHLGPEHRAQRGTLSDPYVGIVVVHGIEHSMIRATALSREVGGRDLLGDLATERLMHGDLLVVTVAGPESSALPFNTYL